MQNFVKEHDCLLISGTNSARKGEGLLIVLLNW